MKLEVLASICVVLAALVAGCGGSDLDQKSFAGDQAFGASVLDGRVYLNWPRMLVADSYTFLRAGAVRREWRKVGSTRKNHLVVPDFLCGNSYQFRPGSAHGAENTSVWRFR